jgi:hypothetical protein
MGPNGKRKREATPTPTPPADSELVEEWLNKFLGLDSSSSLAKDRLVIRLAEIANKADIKTTDIKRARATLPSFSAAKWSTFAEKFGFADDLDNTLFQHVTTPVYSLPPSIHEKMFEAAWRTQDVYQERVEQREAARVRIMDPVSDLLYF